MEDAKIKREWDKYKEYVTIYNKNNKNNKNVDKSID